MTDKKVLIFVLSGMMLLISTCLPAYGAAPDKVSESLYESRLDKGLFNTEPYSWLLINKAHEDKSRAKEFLELAKIYSPDLPAVYFELAKESISLSPTGIFKCIDYFVQGIKAYFRSFWWGFSFAGVMYISLILSLILSLVTVLAIRLPLDAGLFLHEVTEDKRRLALAGIVVLLSLFGPVGFITGVFILISFNILKKNRIVLYVSIIYRAWIRLARQRICGGGHIYTNSITTALLSLVQDLTTRSGQRMIYTKSLERRGSRCQVFKCSHPNPRPLESFKGYK